MFDLKGSFPLLYLYVSINLFQPYIVDI